MRKVTQLPYTQMSIPVGIDEYNYTDLPEKGTQQSTLYPGNKSNAWWHIINQIPPHDVWVTGYAGNCHVTLHKRKAATNFACDVSPKVQPFWAQTRLQYVQFALTPFLQFIQQFTFSNVTGKQWYIYLDPPYLHETRASGNLLYDFELSPEQHQQLITWAIHTHQTSNVLLGISHYPCKLYDTLLMHGWRKIEYTVATHRGPVIEALYMNYPEPVTLHEYTYLGTDFTDRQRIRRKINRWVTNLKNLPALERAAIISKLQKL